MLHADARKSTIRWGNWQTREGRPVDSRPALSFTERITGWSFRHRWWAAVSSTLTLFLTMLVLVDR